MVAVWTLKVSAISLAQLVDAGVTHPAIILPMGYNYERAMPQLSECIFPHFL
jgi:hypothetical protein